MNRCISSIAMSNATYTLMPQRIISLHPNSTGPSRRSPEFSPSRSSVRSNSSQSQMHAPSSSVSSTPLHGNRSPSPEDKSTHLADSDSFLTALAAQEWRVLELSEELHIANEDLEKLKRQWAVHEATKKKSELRQLQQLQPLRPLLTSSMPSGDLPCASSEVDRRRVTTSINKTSHRKVLPGSRHTRALSLLSSRNPESHFNLLLRDKESSRPHQAAAIDVAVPAADPECSSWDRESALDASYRGPQKEMLIETGKQLVGDFRQELWTFFEDFKQLTVGDEGHTTTASGNSRISASINLPSRQDLKEKRATSQKQAKTGSLDVVQESSKDLQIDIPSGEPRVDNFPNTSTKAVGHTSPLTGFNSQG